eukprot:9387611-Alexandrium_andersonii.AAC.1
MSASLVGSEMCIRDRPPSGATRALCLRLPGGPLLSQLRTSAPSSLRMVSMLPVWRPADSGGK